MVCCVCMKVLCGVLRGVCVVRCVGVLVLCWCGVGLCFFSQSSSFSFLLSLFLSSLSFSFYSLFSSLFSSRQQTMHESTTWRPTLRRLNVIWRTASAQHSFLNSQHLPPNCTECCHVGVGSSPLSSSSLPPPSFPPPEKTKLQITGKYPTWELFPISVFS